jgi:hypothetical protein
MKLNLLPSHVSKEGQTRVAWVVMALLSVLSIAAAVGMIVYSQQVLDKYTARANEVKPYYDQAMETAKKADEIMASSVTIDRNLKLAEAMRKHNDVYPDLYNEILRYIPGFYRITNLSASPVSPEVCRVTMTGLLQTSQHYADVMLGMLRMPGVVNVNRSEFQGVRAYVPPLTETDQLGTPVPKGMNPLPSDPEARREEIIARASAEPTGYLNANGFGTPTSPKGAMPGWSQVTINVLLRKNIQTPDPRATLTSVDGAQAPAGGPGAAPFRPPGGGASPPPPPPPPTAAGGRRGRLAEDDE